MGKLMALGMARWQGENYALLIYLFSIYIWTSIWVPSWVANECCLVDNSVTNNSYDILYKPKQTIMWWYWQMALLLYSFSFCFLLFIVFLQFYIMLLVFETLQRYIYFLSHLINKLLSNRFSSYILPVYAGWNECKDARQWETNVWLGIVCWRFGFRRGWKQV